MAKELFISTTPHETKVAVVEDEQLAEIYFERENEYTLAGSIYKGRVTRVLPGMQSAFVDIGLERDAFLYVTDFLEEQEDQEDFEQVSNRVGSDTHIQQSSTAAPAADEQPAANGQTGVADEAEGSDQQFERGPRRWRGRRGRRRGRGGFGEQSTPAQGAAESASQEFAGDGEEEGGGEEPLILPGESLSKYRQAEPQAEAHAAEERVSTEPAVRPPQQEPEQQTFTTPPVPQQSSGSLTLLPGESISKYRSREDGGPQEESAQRPSYSQQKFRERGGARWQRPDRRPERESSRHEEAAAGPPVFALPGESLAKYRREETPSGAEAGALTENSAETESVTASPIAGEQEYAGAEGHEPSSVPLSEDQIAEYKVRRTEPEQSDSEERIEHVLQEAQPDSENTRAESSVEATTAEETSSVPHEFGAGVIEEEVIEEEEADVVPLGDHLDEEIYEELEEETLDAENAEQLVEAVREAHVNQRLGLHKGEPSDLEDHPAGEEVDSFTPDNGAGTDQQIEAADMEDSEYQEEASEHPDGNLE
ncbi:MAG TPA: hypothetical protein VG498_04615, partial [Terriglobales bacterium]|nr:hypothetical protein [Terriglobales bacterium]